MQLRQVQVQSSGATSHPRPTWPLSTDNRRRPSRRAPNRRAPSAPAPRHQRLTPAHHLPSSHDGHPGPPRTVTQYTREQETGHPMAQPQRLKLQGRGATRRTETPTAPTSHPVYSARCPTSNASPNASPSPTQPNARSAARCSALCATKPSRI
ncbi:hypothetical protein CCMSSC00406_0003029 [Pleurotus cornucopiae]|uniref:Uncharacterized protein n=1 Tax=Pleurotus cornucopiae TaxID=5321 RepID=A0ACB7J6B7_PLECO|nr:hypothetical protein CCMSSC00406_0003029 [Pleurotus cornucopiae]